MCTILLAWRCLADASFVLAANRDELIARPATAPQLLHSSPPMFGGRDLLAGGTWLAVTPEGRVAAVTNRRGDDADEVLRDPTRRSRGELPVALLGHDEAEIAAWLSRLRPADYNPFNILAVAAAAALVGHGDRAEALDVVTLDPGLHVLCVHDVDDARHAKEVRIRGRLLDSVENGGTMEKCIVAMTAMLGDHRSESGDGRDAVCIHDETYGTVSASVVALGLDGHVTYRHAAGRPCVTDFVEVAMSAET